MKAATLTIGFVVSIALSTVTTVLAAWMAWPAFGPRGRAALTCLVFGAAVVGIILRWFGRNSTRSKVVCAQLAAMATGELPLTERLDERHQDELTATLNDFLACVDDMIEDVRERAQEIEAGSLELNSGSQQAIEEAEAQAASLEAVGGVIGEVDSFLNQSIDGARNAHAHSRSAEAAVQRASDSVRKMIAVLRPEGSSAEASPRLLASMTDLAFRADLVALNAEVEAARAGEAGKGFAVVARAVRELAHRLGEARRHTAELITDLVKSAERGCEIGASAGENLRTATAENTRSSEFLERVANCTKEQYAGMRRIAEGVVAIDEAIQGSCESARNLAHTSQEAVAQVGHLTQAVETFDGD